MSLLSPFDVVMIWMTDGWPLYESRLKEAARNQQAIYPAN